MNNDVLIEMVQKKDDEIAALTFKIRENMSENIRLKQTLVYNIQVKDCLHTI